MTHELKTWPEFYEFVDKGLKTAELRRDDRGFLASHNVLLREWNPHAQCYTGRAREFVITHVVRNAPEFGLMPGFAMLSIRPISNRT